VDEAPPVVDLTVPEVDLTVPVVDPTFLEATGEADNVGGLLSETNGDSVLEIERERRAELDAATEEELERRTEEELEANTEVEFVRVVVLRGHFGTEVTIVVQFAFVVLLLDPSKHSLVDEQ